eukprot:GHRR01019801.1.p2 GENE.GHRR01019801.1~~GHRR01019801.1.p2  ORF type:complete len:420 (+),score=105.27 GHRR01019801.1:1913-3172(+)
MALDASNNLLTGSLSGGFNEGLQQLYLEYNRLSGQIPAVYGTSAKAALQCWAVHHNAQLCGAAPNGSRCLDTASTMIGLDCSTYLSLNAQHVCGYPANPSMCIKPVQLSNTPTGPLTPPPPPPPPPPPTIGTVQGASLLAWKNSFSTFNTLSSWTSGNDACTGGWAGVICNAAGQVVELRLGAMSATSAAAINWNALGSVTSLRVLELPYIWDSINSVDNQLPAALSSLRNLEKLNMSNNYIAGPLPDAWGSLTALQQLDVSNLWTGTHSIPAAWAGLTALQVLKASGSNLVGEVDALPSMPALKSLLLGNNWQLAGKLPDGWSTRSLQVIDLHTTSIGGTLPSAWGSNSLAASLKELYLHQTKLEGAIPNSWYSGMASITAFTVWSSNVCGPHPTGGSTVGSMCIDTTNTLMGEDTQH